MSDEIKKIRQKLGPWKKHISKTMDAIKLLQKSPVDDGEVDEFIFECKKHKERLEMHLVVFRRLYDELQLASLNCEDTVEWEKLCNDDENYGDFEAECDECLADLQL